MKIKYLAHASFLITGKDGIRIITDPYDQSVGYRMPGESADIVISSHDHFDHSYFSAVRGSFEKVNTAGEKTVKGMRIKGISTAHDEAGGKKRGSNTVFVLEIDGMHIAHLGDLGHVLNESQIREVGQIDVLLSPVGGYFTINAKEAKDNVDRLKPRIVIPMHYKTQSINFPIAPVDEFIKLYGSVRRPGSSEAELTPESLPAQTEVLVLEPSC